jgi:hypothetical protein
VRFFLLCLLLSGCGPPPKSEPPRPDPTRDPWYAETTQRVIALYEEAESLLKQRKTDAAAARITEAQPLAATLLSVPRPTFAATKAASDIDDLYGRMLMANRHFGWARMQFQKNVARWRNWTPQTEESRMLRAEAEKAMAECDRQLER